MITPAHESETVSPPTPESHVHDHRFVPSVVPFEGGSLLEGNFEKFLC